MAGGGIVIIRHSIVHALTRPVVHGALPQHMQDSVDELSVKGTDNWTLADNQTALAIYIWAALHC